MSETNILAMLDRQASTGLPQRLLRGARTMPAVFWYSGASVLVCGMVATLAWLAHDSGAPVAADTALAGAITPGPARVAAADPASVTASVTAHVPAPMPAPVPAHASDPAPNAGATIVNVAAAPADLMVQAPAAVPKRQEPGHSAPHEVQRDPQRPAAHAVMARTALPRAPAQIKTAAAAARNRRHSAPAKAVAPPVDTDVALISAIIQHAATRQETEDAACADKACGPRMPAKP